MIPLGERKIIDPFHLDLGQLEPPDVRGGGVTAFDLSRAFEALKDPITSAEETARYKRLLFMEPDETLDADAIGEESMATKKRRISSGGKTTLVGSCGGSVLTQEE
jgi:hypothetical protein